MGRALPQTWALAAFVLGSPLQAQASRPSFAVLPFENSGSYGQDKEIFQALELGIPATIAATLAAHPAANVADAARVRQALKAQGLAPAQRVDASTAGLVAKAVGARYTVTGSFADFYGKFRINARLVDAENGQIIKVVSNDDPRLQDRAQLAAIILAVSQKLLAAAGLPPIPADAAARSAAVPTEALNQYSRGVLFENRGDDAKASESYQRAITVFPGYTLAEEGLRRVRGS